MLSRRFDNFGNFSNQQETRQDSVSHQFKKVLQWPLKEQNRIGILSKIPFKRVRETKII
jgi:hypothetical protein